jgi:hypothetical protein
MKLKRRLFSLLDPKGQRTYHPLPARPVGSRGKKIKPPRRPAGYSLAQK